jgi:hypothetical protein
VNQIADEIAEVPHKGILQNKEVLNTDLEIMGRGRSSSTTASTMRWAA